MGNVILLLTCFVIGILLRRSKRLPENAHAAWNGFVIHVSLPALTLVYVHDLKLSAELLFPAAMAWLLFGVGCAFFWGVGRLLRLPSRTTGALTLVGGLGNTSFVGLPMIETYYGTRGLGVGILIDQAGTYLVLSTLGILMATYYRQEGGMNVRAIVRKILTFAPFLAFVVSLVLIPVTYPEWLDALLRRLGGTLVPLALASVGYQIQWKSMRSKLREVGIGLAFKLRSARRRRAGAGGSLRGAGRDDSDHDLRSRDGAADRSRHRRLGPRPRSAARHADGRDRHPAVVPDAAVVVADAPAAGPVIDRRIAARFRGGEEGAWAGWSSIRSTA